MIAGTAIGAGMLGIPLVTGEVGFKAGALATVLVWLYLYVTGLMLMEVSVSMKAEGGFLEMAGRYLPKYGKPLVGFLFFFLYGILLVAYISAGAQIFCLNLFESFYIRALFPILLVGLLMLRSNRVITIISALTIPMWIYFGVLYFLGAPYIEGAKLLSGNLTGAYVAVPILFGAFGYHNVIPSVSKYLNFDKKALKQAIFLGSFIPCLIYFFWQILILGMVDSETLLLAREKGVPVVALMGKLTKNSLFEQVGSVFAFFALLTSAVGVAISVVHFVDTKERKGTAILVILIPALIAFIKPDIFLMALSFAGGFGESILNGIIPIWLFVAYKARKEELNSKWMALALVLLLVALSVVGIELLELI
ncbi:hypothetical protein K0U07_04410 [bacterium]|nr:hypothetical protein [bacterium]